MFTNWTRCMYLEMVCKYMLLMIESFGDTYPTIIEGGVVSKERPPRGQYGAEKIKNWRIRGEQNGDDQLSSRQYQSYTKPAGKTASTLLFSFIYNICGARYFMLRDGEIF